MMRVGGRAEMSEREGHFPLPLPLPLLLPLPLTRHVGLCFSAYAGICIVMVGFVVLRTTYHITACMDALGSDRRGRLQGVWIDEREERINDGRRMETFINQFPMQASLSQILRLQTLPTLSSDSQLQNGKCGVSSLNGRPT